MYSLRTDSAVEIENSSIPMQVSTRNLSCQTNVDDLKKLQSVIFPVQYNDRFYRDLQSVHPEEFCRLVYWSEPGVKRRGNSTQGNCIGALCCRLEWDDDLQLERPQFPPKALAFIPNGPKLRCYIMTIGVLAPYRSLGIGQYLMEYLEKVLQGQDGQPWRNVKRIWLHVHVGNEGAVKFYERLGFIRKKLEKDYYKRNRGVPDPPDAWLLEKTW